MAASCMQAFSNARDRFLEQELDLKERALVIVAALLLAAVYLFPLWNLTMFAPQYPDGLRIEHLQLQARRRATAARTSRRSTSSTTTSA